MKICFICSEKIIDVTPDNRCFCYHCKKEVGTIETTSLTTALIDYEVQRFEYLDLITQLELILDSKGTNDQKIDKILFCFENI